MAKNSLGTRDSGEVAGALAGPVPGSMEPAAGSAAGHPPPGALPPRRQQAAALLRAAIEMCGLKNGMTISTHHALRNGDVLLNLLVKEIDAMGCATSASPPARFTPSMPRSSPTSAKA